MPTTLTKARDALKQKTCSSRELTDFFLKRIEEDISLNAYITVTPDRARAQADASDQRRHKGIVGRMEGLPLGIKDLFCTHGVRTTAGSKILENFIPPYESTVTENLLKEGSVFLGKTNMDEFAMGSTNMTSAFGPTLSPWRSSIEPNRSLVPGGSSGGSSAAVSAGLCLAATGSDTGGSIRQPAAFCGLVGIKPTYGLCSRWGMIAFASSLDQAGPLTHTVADSALMLSVMASFDPKDSTSAQTKIPDYEKNLSTDVRGLRIGIPKEYREGLNSEMADLWDKGCAWFQSVGAEIIDISLPLTQEALPVYYIIAPAEASSNLARYDGVRYGFRTESPKNLDELYAKTRGEGLGSEVRRRILMGTYVLSAGHYDAYYVRAQKIRQRIRHDFNTVFENVDLILTPTVPSSAFPLDAKPTNPVEMYLNDIFTVTVNLAGLPAISVPAGYDSKELPLGLQLIAPAFQEQRLLNAGAFLEEASGFQSRLLNRV